MCRTATSRIVLFTTGAASVPLTVPVTGSFALAGYNGTSAANARLAALTQLLAADTGNTFAAGANAIATQALQLSSTVNPILAGAPCA